jgi:3-oxoacyl-[acyl-carrier protein] reductase
MVRRFAAEGAQVHAADINADIAGILEREIVGNPRHQPAGHVLDVTEATAVEALADRIGRVDVLVNNAGIIRDGRAEHISDEDWSSVLAVNLTGAFQCIRAVLPGMKTRGQGRIISFSSMSWRGNFGQANYVAAKAGIVGLTRAIALEGARHGITANAVAPGLIDTPMLASMNGPARDKLLAKVPLQRAGHPDDIAAAVSFLASDEARYITGVVLDVDGGISIGSSIR